MFPFSVMLQGGKKSKEKIEGRKIKLKEINTAQRYICITMVEIRHIRQREEKNSHVRKLPIAYYKFVPSLQYLQYMLHLLDL